VSTVRLGLELPSFDRCFIIGDDSVQECDHHGAGTCRPTKTHLHRMLFMNEFRLAVHLSRASNFHDVVVHGTTIDTSLKWYKTGI